MLSDDRDRERNSLQAHREKINQYFTSKADTAASSLHEEETRTDLVGCHGQAAIEILHQLFECRSLRGHGVPAVPHHHVPAHSKNPN